MSRTMAVHLRYKSWYISLLSSAKQHDTDQIMRCMKNVNNDGYFF